MGCEEYTRLISTRLDGELTPEEAARLDAHLAVCPQCRVLVRELEEMRTAFAWPEPVQPPVELSRGVLDRIRAQRIARRRVMVRRVGGLVAALVLCAGLYPMLRAMAPMGESGMAMEAADTAAPMEPTRYVEQEAAADGALLDTNVEKGKTIGEPQNSQTASRTMEEYKYSSATQAKKKLRLSDTDSLPKPAAQVLDSVQGLQAFLARFDGDDWSGVTREYDEEFFRTGRLLAVVVQEPSSSITHEVTGLDEVRVRVKRHVPQAGDSDMACWLLLVEGDERFGSTRALDVEWTEE